MNSLHVIEIAQKKSQGKCLSQVDSVSHYQLEQKIPPIHFRLVRSLCELARTAPECCGRRSPPGAAASSCNTTPGSPDTPPPKEAFYPLRILSREPLARTCRPTFREAFLSRTSSLRDFVPLRLRPAVLSGSVEIKSIMNNQSAYIAGSSKNFKFNLR